MIRVLLAFVFLQASVLSAETLLTTQVPQTSSGTQAWSLGVRISASVPGRVTAIRYYRLAEDPGPHIGHIWASNGTKLAEIQFTNETAVGWQRQQLTSPIFVSADSVFVITVDSPQGARYALQPGGFTNPLVNGHLSASTGVYGVFGQFPVGGITPTNYFRDCEFVPQSIVIMPDPLFPGGFIATLDGFQEGSYTLSVTMQGAAGSMTESILITMPSVKP
jgi:hypothetical protein